MTLPSWAYQVDSFDPPPNEELVCSVCRGIFCDPVQTPCDHVYCRNCLFRWLENNRTCPICRKRTTRSSVKEVVQLIKNMIMKLTLRCGNWDNNCREKFTLETCEAHVRTCPYEMIQCKNKPCLKMFLRKDIQDHELKNCVHRTVRCRKCYLKIQPNVKSHDCIPALRRKVRAQEEDLKKKNKKIKELQKELKKLQAAQQAAASSDISSIGSVSAADIMIDLEDMSSLSPVSSVDSFLYDTDEDEYSFFEFGIPDSYPTSAILNDFLSIDRSNDDSSDFPMNRVSFLDTDVSGSVDDEPVVRRPNKRRHPMQTADSSDDNNNEDSPQVSVWLPSPKRSLNLLQRINEASQSTPGTDNNRSDQDHAVAGPSHASSYGDAAETSRSRPFHHWELSRKSRRQQSPHGPNSKGEGDGPAARHSDLTSDAKEERRGSKSASASVAPKPNKTENTSRRTRRIHTRSRQPSPLFTFLSENSPVPTSTNSGFERTIALLRQYNLESDDEWVPAREDAPEESSDSDGPDEIGMDEVDCILGQILPSTGSSSSDSDDTSSSYESPAQREWFHRYLEY